MYQIILSRNAKKDIEKLDIVGKKRLKKALIKFSANPFSSTIKLKGSNTEYYRFRVGNYRVIFDLEGKIIKILRIQHRKNAYRNLI